MGEQTMQNKLEFLLERVSKQNPQANIKKIRAAYEYAAAHHAGQNRKDGSPFITHPQRRAVYHPSGRGRGDRGRDGSRYRFHLRRTPA